MVVDDAIVVLENVTNHIERGSEPMQAAVHGTNEVGLSVVASTLTLIAVFFPLTLVTGMTGVLFPTIRLDGNHHYGYFYRVRFGLDSHALFSYVEVATETI